MELRDTQHWNEIFRRGGIPLALDCSQFGESADVVTLHAGEKPEEQASWPVHVVVTDSPRVEEIAAKERNHSVLLLTPSATPELAESLRENGVAYADERGNCFISGPGILIDVRGRASGHRRRRVSSLSRKPTASLFTPRRSQVVAMILDNPDLLEAPMRTIAKLAGVSVGTVAQTLDLLATAGYLGKSELHGTYRFERIAPLLDAWARAFSSGLGEHLELFRGDGDVDRLAAIPPLGWVSGEQAVPGLVQGGRSVHLYISGQEDLPEILRAARLRKADEGEIVLRSAFWPGIGQRGRAGDVEGPVTAWPKAPRPLIYADLLSTNQPRLVEVAQEVRSEIID
ncbi:type IV toxin-antitoxin system AbiEi family antitoxin [Corynebacterium sp.]|uniref:type IV toxin-antitoxin system AbiEi family antitoxin n=1 Tax=Corynebacterium sp. TaxID=1720 RepID=UPI002A916AD0|nr:type IV toxin-antitoxin system AbiEi family antitoxin [Corynebacterium sp.]MDY5786478.1 type IV toxin-antitoxin system AbiEi family antitoxin [Corynebacterium sp.]